MTCTEFILLSSLPHGQRQEHLQTPDRRLHCICLCLQLSNTSRWLFPSSIFLFFPCSSPLSVHPFLPVRFLLLPPLNQIRRLLRHSINSTTQMRPWNQRHNTRIHDPHSLDSINLQLSIHDTTQLAGHQRRRPRQMRSSANNCIPRRLFQIFLTGNLRAGRQLYGVEGG